MAEMRGVTTGMLRTAYQDWLFEVNDRPDRRFPDDVLAAEMNRNTRWGSRFLLSRSAAYEPATTPGRSITDRRRVVDRRIRTTRTDGSTGIRGRAGDLDGGQSPALLI